MNQNSKQNISGVKPSRNKTFNIVSCRCGHPLIIVSFINNAGIEQKEPTTCPACGRKK